MPPHRPKPFPACGAQPNKVGQGDIGLELHREGQHLDVLEADPFLLQVLGDLHLEALVEFPAHAAGKGEDMRRQDVFQEGEAFCHPLQLLPLPEVLGIEGPPFVQAVREALFPDVEVDLVHVQAGDAHFVVLAADVQPPVRLAEKMVGLLDAVVEAEEHGAHLAAMRIYLILYKRVAVVVATIGIVVVVEPLVFDAHFPGNGTPKPFEVPGLDTGVERHGQKAELFHWRGGLFGLSLRSPSAHPKTSSASQKATCYGAADGFF